MNIPVQTLQTKTMSSLEIAELTGKNHKDVLRDIKKILEEAEIQPAQFCASYKAGNGQMQPCFNLPRRECDLIIAGYSVKYRLAIIDRWQELEKQNPLPTSFSEALLLAGKIQAEKEAALLKIAQDKPKVEFANIITEDSNTRCIRIWIKAMKHENNLIVGEREVFKWLLENRYIFKDKNGYLPYSRYESNGCNYFTVVIDEINGKPRRQLKITGKGVVALTGKVVKAFAQDEVA